MFNIALAKMAKLKISQDNCKINNFRKAKRLNFELDCLLL